MSETTKKRDLVLDNLALVEDECPSFLGRGLEDEDVRQAGFLGLCVAARRFEARFSDGQFRAFARFWIRGQMAIALQTSTNVRIPSPQRRIVAKCLRAGEVLFAAGRLNPSIDEMAFVAGVDVGAARAAFACPRRADGDAHVLGLVEDEEKATDREIRDALDESIDKLSRREAFVVISLFGLDGLRPMSQHYVARAMMVNVREVGRLKNSAIRALKHYLAAKGFRQSDVVRVLYSRVA